MGNLNRKRYVLSRRILYNLFLSTLFFLLLFFIYFENKNIILLSKEYLENISEKFGYQYIKLDLKGLKRVNNHYIEKKLEKYSENSIFLLPLNDISNSLKENNWIKNVKLKTNFKNTLFVNIEEYKPLGIYSFNDRFFYFDANGKIIDEYNSNHKLEREFIIFKGQSSNLEAKFIIEILNSLNFQEKYKIDYLELINNRRWDIVLADKKLLMLSENDPKKSLYNFIEIKNNLNEMISNDIITYDLRNINKIVVTSQK